MKKHILTYFLLIGLCLLTKSCIKEDDFRFDNLTFDGSYVYDLPIPLVDARLTMSDLLKNIDGQDLFADSNGLLRIFYQDEVLYDFSDLKIDVPNQAATISPSFTVPSPFSDDSINFLNTFVIPFFSSSSDPNVRLDTIQVKAMDFVLLSPTIGTVQNRVRFEIRSSDIVDSLGRPFSMSAPLQPTAYTLNLTNYRIVPSSGIIWGSKQIRFDLVTTIFKDTTVTEEYTFRPYITARLEDIEADLMYGFFGRKILGPKDGAMDLPIFSRFPMDFIEVEKAYMNLSVTNNSGLPIELDAELSTLTHAPDIRTFDTIVSLNHPQNLLASPITATFQQEIQELINDNSGYLPYEMQYSVKVTTNPSSTNPLSVMNFLSENSFIKMNVGVEIPMKLNVKGFTVADTVAFAGIPFSGDIEAFTIRANIHNAFPIGAAVFLYFLNEDYQVMDSVKLTDIAAALVNSATGQVIDRKISQIDTDLSRTQITHLETTRYFRIAGVLDTDGEDTMVGIYEDSEKEGFLKVMIGCRIKASRQTLDDIQNLFKD